MMAGCVHSSCVRARNADAQALQNRIDALALGDRSVARAVTNALIDTNRTTLLCMMHAHDREAWDDLSRAVHHLAGSLRMLECRREIAVTLRLERAAIERDARAIVALLPPVTEAVMSLNERLIALST